MRRLFWVGVGATGAVLLARRLERAARRYSPAGLADQVEAAGDATSSALRDAATRFRTARATREAELVDQLLVTPESGDAGAVFGRGRTSGQRRPGASGRPAEDLTDEPLYEF
ncbi:hypothetical protein J4G33_01440 [Actinotalea sp. BY-33]|uniref:Uncharacterized protein n=1 Tax=Actinotalea soli TaxID=2819234 RepID=A0A939LME1_9CELL|nr:hypothetical protein [Actinotalea soli]MBO1750462.1 hypothetical protein [Actinotalea soli]